MFTSSMVVVPWGAGTATVVIVSFGVQHPFTMDVPAPHDGFAMVSFHGNPARTHPQPQFSASCMMPACARRMRWLYALPTINV